MINEITNTLIEVLQDNLENLSKNDISAKRNDLKKMPFIHVTNKYFNVVDIGVGRSLGGGDQTQIDLFSGDGKKNEFTLTEKPVRPIISVESPKGRRVQEENYDVDYIRGVILFPVPPKEGEDNIRVRYLKPFETTGIKLNLVYGIDVHAEDEVRRDVLTVKVMEVLLREERALNSKGVYLKPIKGYNIGIEGEFTKGLEYEVEVDLEVNVPFPRIERIDLQNLFDQE